MQRLESVKNDGCMMDGDGWPAKGGSDGQLMVQSVVKSRSDDKGATGRRKCRHIGAAALESQLAGLLLVLWSLRTETCLETECEQPTQ